MKFSLEVNMDNDAFIESDNGYELARILHRLAGQVEGTVIDGDRYDLFDFNGNKVGIAEVEE